MAGQGVANALVVHHPPGHQRALDALLPRRSQQHGHVLDCPIGVHADRNHIDVHERQSAPDQRQLIGGEPGVDVIRGDIAHSLPPVGNHVLRPTLAVPPRVGWHTAACADFRLVHAGCDNRGVQHSQAEGPFAKEPGAQASGPLVERAEIIRAALGLALYAAAFGLSFGAVAVASGLSVPQAIVLSLVLFSGASQFAFVGVAATGSPFAAIPAALLLGVRNTFYGVTIAQILRPRGWRRVLAAHFSIDETAAMAAAQRSTRAKRYAFWASGAAMFMLWNVGSLAGALLGSVLDTATFGSDDAAQAAFLALLWPALRTARGRWVAAGSVVLALVLIPLVPAGVPVLAAVLVAVAAGWHEVRGSEAGAAHGEGAAAPEGPLGGQGSGSPESPGSGDPQQPRRPGKDDR